MVLFQRIFGFYILLGFCRPTQSLMKQVFDVNECKNEPWFSETHLAMMLYSPIIYPSCFQREFNLTYASVSDSTRYKDFLCYMIASFRKFGPDDQQLQLVNLRKFEREDFNRFNSLLWGIYSRNASNNIIKTVGKAACIRYAREADFSPCKWEWRSLETETAMCFISESDKQCRFEKLEVDENWCHLEGGTVLDNMTTVTIHCSPFNETILRGFNQIVEMSKRESPELLNKICKQTSQMKNFDSKEVLEKAKYLEYLSKRQKEQVGCRTFQFEDNRQNFRNTVWFQFLNTKENPLKKYDIVTHPNSAKWKWNRPATCRYGCDRFFVEKKIRI